ncbi:capsule biosynthesis GfcC family protein [Rheinheimera gaetbuli]
MSNRYLATLCLLLCSSLSQAAVSIDVNGERRDYPHNPRLAEVLQPYALTQPWYWPAAALYQTDSQHAQVLRQQLLQLATEIAQQSDDALLRDSLALLQAQVNQWQLADRVNLALDYDAATIQPALNPRFDNGSYRIVLKRRPVVVHIAGAVKRSFSVPHISAGAVARYVADSPMIYGADRDRLMIIQPDGRVIAAGISHWNHEHIEAMPGAQLLVLFAEPVLDGRFARLNALLQQLAAHRILP